MKAGQEEATGKRRVAKERDSEEGQHAAAEAPAAVAAPAGAAAAVCPHWQGREGSKVRPPDRKPAGEWGHAGRQGDAQ